MTVLVDQGLLWTSWPDASFRVTSTLEWDSEDPQALRVTFHEEDDRPWIFGRDLVQAALAHGCAGSGDVRVRALDAHLILSLTSPLGAIALQCEASRIADFIARTYARVPQQAESAEYAPLVDAAIERFYEEYDG